MILYGMRVSPFVRKVMVYAAEKGLKLEGRPGGFGFGGPEFEAISPFRKMPALADGDFSVCDSTAIIAYLEALHPEPALVPAAPRERARTVWFEEFADTILWDVAGKMFSNRVVARINGRTPDLDAADQAEREGLPPILDYLEQAVPGAGFIVGDALSVADISVTSPFVNMAYAGFEVSGEAYPRLRAYLDAMLARPSFVAAKAGEEKQIAMARAA